MKRTQLAVLCACVATGTALSRGPGHAERVPYSIEEHQVSAADDGVCNVYAATQVNERDARKVLWFAESGANRIGRLDLQTGQTRKFDLPKVTPVGYTTKSIDALPTADADFGVCDLLVSPDGMLWFNYQAANSVGYMQTQPPYAIKLLELPTPKSLPMAFQLGSDGNIYVELTAVDKIARVDPKSHEIKEYVLPETHAGIVGGAASLHGGVHWFVLMNSNKLLRFEYATGKMQTFAIPTAGAAPFVIRSYDDGLWFTLFGANAIGHFDPRTEKFTQILLPTQRSAPIGIALGRDGDLYSDQAGSDQVARIDRKTSSVVAELDLPTKGAFADEIKVGPDGALWVPEMMTGKVARVWPASFGKDVGSALDSH